MHKTILITGANRGIGLALTKLSLEKKINVKYDNILIFNGFYTSSFLSMFNRKNFINDFEINYLIPMEIASFAIKKKILKKNGAIYFISSIAASEHHIGNANYSISKNAHLIANVPPARLYEEVIKLFHNESSLVVFRELSNLGILKYLFPYTQEDAFISASLINTSERIRTGNSVTPAFLFAVFLWSAQNKRLNEINKKKMSHIELMIKASEDVIRRQVQQVMMPRWLSGRVRDIWLLQYRLENYNPKKSQEIMSNPRFRMAYDFFVLRSESVDPHLRD